MIDHSIRSRNILITFADLTKSITLGIVLAIFLDERVRRLQGAVPLPITATESRR